MSNPGSAVTMDEIGEQLAAASNAGVDPSAVKLEGDKIPEIFRGKTLADILEQNKNLATGLETANKARRDAESAAAASNNRPAEIRQPDPAPAPKLTKEQLAELFEKDPIGAVAYMQDVAIQDAAANFERRFAPITAGSANVAESGARTRFVDEFALFDKDIKQVVDAMPDKSILANPAAWDNVISFIRGKPGNFEKLVELRGTKAAEAAAAAARNGQIESAGASMSSSFAAGGGGGNPAPAGSGNFGLTEDERHAADVMGTSYADYAKWKKIGG